MSKQVVDTYDIQTGIVPSALAVQNFDLNPALVESPPYNAYIYTYCDTRILLVRLSDDAPSYDNATEEQSIAVNLNWLRALLYDQAKQVDGLVLDQTHNPGGDLEFAQDVLALLTTQSVPGIVQKMHGDRVWIQAFTASRRTSSTLTRWRTSALVMSTTCVHSATRWSPPSTAKTAKNETRPLIARAQLVTRAQARTTAERAVVG